MTTPTPRTIRLRSGIKTVNGITGETAPTYSEYVLLEDYQRDLAAAQEKNAKLKSHAEALHLQLKRFIGDHFFAAPHTSITTDEAWEAKQVADAYSRDFPKEGT